MKRIGVIGGGIGGLTGAICLAKAGYLVTLHEKNKSLGGKMNTLRLGKYRFDTGPTLITMPQVPEEIFNRCGTRMSDHLKLVAIDPLCRYFFSDGILDAHADFCAMRQAVRKFNPDEVGGLERFFNYTQRIYRRAAEIFLNTPIHELSKVMRLKYWPSFFMLYQIDPFRTMHQAVSTYFKDARLIQLFDRYATYNGSNPFQAPATLNIIPYVEYKQGGYYVQGGLYRLVQVLERLAQDLGVEIRTRSYVQKIHHCNGRVISVETEQQVDPVDAVLCNMDAVETYNRLIRGFPGVTNKLNAMEPSLSGVVFYWGIRIQSEQLAHHNILFSDDYYREFQQISRQEIPDDPTIYISISSKTDPRNAPEGCENWFVFINTPFHSHQKWESIISVLRKTVFNKLKKIGIHIESHIETEQIRSPEDFYQLFYSNRGSIYGLSSNNPGSAFRRPANRSHNLKALYFAGGSVHPGGGVPLCIRSGRIAADLMIERDLR
jgi:phytoene desaturase